MRRTSFDPEQPLLRDGYVFSMTAQHEAQHQETILQALDLRQDLEPYPILARRLPEGRTVDDEERVTIPEGQFQMGTDDRADAYDNERPRHWVHVAGFTIDRFPVTARRYGAFVADRGYERQELWSAEGWEHRLESGIELPSGWISDLSGGWLVRRFGHVGPLDPREPVQHVSYHEAEAFCRWDGGRLPTESEWEKAAAWDEAESRSRTYPWGEARPTLQFANLDHAGWGPAAVGSYPSGVSAYGVEQLIGDVYEWASSRFEGYDGYSTFPYKEYSEVFFGEEYRVLRGASWATTPMVARNTFRNRDYPIRRQIFCGFRVAKDLA